MSDGVAITCTIVICVSLIFCTALIASTWKQIHSWMHEENLIALEQDRDFNIRGEANCDKDDDDHEEQPYGGNPNWN